MERRIDRNNFIIYQKLLNEKVREKPGSDNLRQRLWFIGYIEDSGIDTLTVMVMNTGVILDAILKGLCEEDIQQEITFGRKLKSLYLQTKIDYKK